MLDILKSLENDTQYDDDFTLIQDLIKRINGILNDDNITNDFIDKMDNDLNYLDQKYDDLFDLINLFDPIYVELKRRNHNDKRANAGFSGIRDEMRISVRPQVSAGGKEKNSCREG